MRVEITIGDCSAYGHYAYCYIAGNCQPMELNAGGCASGDNDTVTTIYAPKGMDQYTWYYSRNGVVPSTDPTNVAYYNEITGTANQRDSLKVLSRYFLRQGSTTDYIH